MKKTIYDIVENVFLKNTLCLLLLSMAAPVLAQDDATESGDDEETEEVRRPVNREQKEKYELKTVKGTVFDLATKKPLAGIQMKMLGNGRYAAMSDEDGTFEIKVPYFATALYVFSPDYLSQQVAIGKADEPVTVNMLSDKFRTMYGEGNTYTAEKSFHASRVQDVTIDNEISAQLGADVRNIQRSAAPGIGNAMFVRGFNSLYSNAMPLVIIDGVEQDMQYDRLSLHQGQFNNMLANVMPADVEKVTVLKNATALYGARGGNGVIIIDTKRGRSMATRIDANISAGVSFIPRLPKMLNSNQYRSYASELLGTISELQTINPDLRFLEGNASKPYYMDYNQDYDWTDDTYRNALTQNYNINVQGGDNVGMYNLSVGYVKANSTAEKNDFSRMNVRFNTDIYILRNLSTQFNIAIARTSNSVFDDGAPEDFSQAAVSSPTFLSLIKSPVLYPYQWNDRLNKWTDLLSSADNLYYDQTLRRNLVSGSSLANPVAILENAEGVNKNSAENTNFQATLAPKLELGRYFTLTELFNYTLNRNAQRYHRPYEGSPRFRIANLGDVTARFGTLFANENSIYSNTRLTFDKDFGKHHVNAFAGFSYSYFAFDSDQLTTDFTGSMNDKNPKIEAGASNHFYVGGANDEWKNMKWYGNVDYNYLSRYYLTLSLSAEANSRFGSDAGGVKLGGVCWALFPSVQAGWVITNEEWFPKNRSINYLRLNVGYDLSGNDNISNYAAQTSYTLVQYSRYGWGLQLTNIGNDKVKWETTRKFNAGLQGHFVDNRISLSIDYFRHKTSDLLSLKSFDNPQGGIESYWSNGGELKNEGFEVSAAVKPVVTKDWHVEVGASVGHYKNEVTKLPNGDREYHSAYGTDNILTKVGGPVALFYGYQTAGVFSSDLEASKAGNGTYLYMENEAGKAVEFKAGDVHFVDQDGNGKIDENDRVVIGDPNPDIYGNIFATINWKNLTLSATFNYSLGNDVFNYQRMVLNSSSNFYNQQVAVTGRWRYEDQQTDMPRAVYGDPMNNNRFSDRWIEDGSYLRLKSLTLTYKVPVNFSWLQGLSIWAEGSNLFTLTKYLGSDPEFSVANSVLYQGIDAGYLSQGRAVTLGMKVNL